MELSDELSIRQFFGLIRRRKREFAAWWLVVFSGVAIYTFSVTPMYRAEALLRIQMPEDTSHNSQMNALGLAMPHTAFNVEQLLSPIILDECVKRLRHAETIEPEYFERLVANLDKRVRVQFSDSEHTMVSVSVLSRKPEFAALETNELARVMVEIVGEDMNVKMRRTKEFIQNQLKETGSKLRDSEDRLRQSREKADPQSAGVALGGRLVELRNRRAELLQKYTSEHPLVKQTNAEIRIIESQFQQVPVQEIDLTRIAREVKLNEELFTMLTKRLEEAQITESARIAPVSIVDAAVAPSVPEFPNKKYNLIMGMLAGALVGLIAVLARHHFDTSMVTPEEIEQYLQLPVLAAIPHIERRSAPRAQSPGGIARKKDAIGEARFRLIMNFPPQSPHSEVHHLLRNNLMKDVKNGESRVYLFTSAVAAEGKSITAANFAIAAAQSGIPTLLAEVDLREPMVDRLFGIPSEPGVTNYFYTSPRWETSVARWEQIKNGEGHFGDAINLEGLANLHVLPSGKRPSNPVSLLSSDRFPVLLQSMRQRYPLIILDGAPALLFADSSILGAHVDGIILVYRFGRTAREVLRRTHNQLVASNAKILGIVVNDIMQGQDASYNRYYGAYYKGYRETPSRYSKTG